MGVSWFARAETVLPVCFNYERDACTSPGRFSRACCSLEEIFTRHGQRPFAISSENKVLRARNEPSLPSVPFLARASPTDEHVRTPVNFRTCRTVERRGRKLEFFARARALKPKPRHNALPAKLSLTPRTGVFLSVSERVSHAKLSSSHQVLPCTFSSFEPSYYYHPHVYKPYTRTRTRTRARTYTTDVPCGTN